MRKIAFIFTTLLILVGTNTNWTEAQTRNPTPTPTRSALVQLPRFEGGEERTITEPVDRDLILGGGQLTVTSTVNGDAYIGGGQIDFKGNTTGDLIVAGGNITISGNIGRNLIVAGGQVNVDETANITGYVLAAGGQIRLDGKFAGPVKIAGGRLDVAETTEISGSLEADVGEAQISDKATILGERKVNIHERKDTEEIGKKAAGFAAMGSIYYLLSQVVSMIVLVALVPSIVSRGSKMLKNFWGNLGLGVTLLVATPVLAVVAMLTLVGLPVGIITLVLYVMALYLTGLVIAAAIGGWIHEKGWVKSANPYLLSLLGLAILGILVWIPLIGWIVKFLTGALGMGIIYRMLTTKS